MAQTLLNQGVRKKVVIAIFAAWSLVAALVLWQFSLISSSSRSLDELTNRLMHFRETLYFAQPYRANQAPNLELELSLVLALRMQIEAEQSRIWIRRDVQQLLYQTDRFVEQARAFLTIELHPTELAERFRESRQRVHADPQLLSAYFQLGAFSFEALFADNRNSPEIYRSLDRILQDSLTLPSREQELLQVALAQVSRLLTQYAEGDNLVGKLLNHAVYEEASMLEEEYHHQLWIMMVILVGASSIAMLCFIVLPSRPQFLPRSASNQENTKFHKLGGMSHQVNIALVEQTLNGDFEAVRQLLKVFLEDHKNDDEQIRSLLLSNPEAAQRHCHSLKSVAASLGAERLKQVAAEIESHLRAGQLPSERALDNLSAYLAETVREAEWHVSRLPSDKLSIKRAP
ncbi:TPA: Hpt domain-containing protein [Vibrio cholerae]